MCLVAFDDLPKACSRLEASEHAKQRFRRIRELTLEALIHVTAPSEDALPHGHFRTDAEARV
eukprot:scaffold48_cov311-Pinguiococcus_pyrenoidosus.AAC.293